MTRNMVARSLIAPILALDTLVVIATICRLSCNSVAIKKVILITLFGNKCLSREYRVVDTLL